MSRASRLVVFTLCMTGMLTPPAIALNGTVGSPTAIDLENYAQVWGQDGTTFEQAVFDNHYAFEDQVDLNLADGPKFTLEDFGLFLQSGFGLWLVSCHGGVDELMIEAYDWAQGEDDRDAAYTNYVNAGYPVRKCDDFGTAWGICVNESFIDDRYNDLNSMIYVAACESATSYDAWLPYRAYLGYLENVTICSAQSEVRTLYDRMAGHQGYELRSLSAATQDYQPIFEMYGDVNTVLAPTVTEMFPPQNHTIDQKISGYVRFDCDLDQFVFASDIVRAAGSVSLSSPRWVSAHEISFNLTGHAAQNGWFDVLSANSGQVDFARTPSGIALDGNTIPPPPDNGVAPNGDGYQVLLNSNVEDNPAATLTHSLPAPLPEGVHIRWQTGIEIHVDEFLVERAGSRFGPFTAIREVPPAGPSEYEVVDSLSSGGFYRLREVDTFGDTLYHFSDTVTVPDPTVPPDEEWTLDPDSLMQVQTNSFPGGVIPAGPPSDPVEYLIICPADDFFSHWSEAIAPLASFHTERGLLVAVQFLELPTSAAEVKSAIEAEYAHGSGLLKYVLVVGDANDHLFPRAPGSPTQPEFDIIPAAEYVHRDMIDDQIIANGGSPGSGFSSWTPYVPSDWPYVDFDADGLPDIAIGRLPVRSSRELTYAVEKILLANQFLVSGGTYQDRVAMWLSDLVSDQGTLLGSLSGDLVRESSQAVVTALPSHLTIDLLSTRDIPTYADREAAAVDALRLGAGLVTSLGILSSTNNVVGFLNQEYGFRWSDLRDLSFPPGPPPPPALFLATSCDLANFDQSETEGEPHHGRGRPLLERGVVDAQLGPWAVFGPTRGSRQFGNGLIAREFVDLAYNWGTPSAGWAASLAVSNVARSEPQYRDYARSFVFLGDPALPLAGQVQTVAVDEGDDRTPQEAFLRLTGANPSVGDLRLAYGVPHRSRVKISLYDVKGRRVGTLFDGVSEPGEYRLSVDPRECCSAVLTAGVYFVRYQIDGVGQRTLKSLLVK